MKASSHISVLRDEVIEALAPRLHGRYIDCTVGHGGHSRALLEQAEIQVRVLGLDADPQALEIARINLAPWQDRITLVQSNFEHIGRVVEERQFAPVDGIIMDLGWSSSQVADAARGFSFQADGPLDMRFSSDQGVTAADLVNTLDETELAALIWRYGEERKSRRIARAIVAHRPVERTRDLADIIERVMGRRQKIHPATRTFQALRIAVNDELGVLERALEQLPDLLAPAGVLAIISFHSLEDRIVKQFFQRESAECICPPEAPVCVCEHQPRLEWKPRKPVTPSDEEIAGNPRSRSAKLRIARRIAEAPR
jgi:16S rRNA (cytosine1402-N4)-methyltransferase